MAALTMAICSGVTRTSYWPMADWASCGALRLAGTELGLTRMGTRSTSPKPVLQEISSAWVRVDGLPGPQGRPSSLGRSVLVSGRSSRAGPGTTEFSVYLPEESAAAAVTSLKVEPGG